MKRTMKRTMKRKCIWAVVLLCLLMMGTVFYKTPVQAAGKPDGWVLQKDGGQVYYKGGRRLLGWHTIDGRKYYFRKSKDKRCHMAVGYVYIDGSWEHFTENGVCATGGVRDMFKIIRTMKSDTRFIILVNRRTNKVGIFEKNSKTTWKLNRYMVCATGKYSTPSRKGVFRVSGRGKSFGHSYTCWYWVRWYGNYLFHSILYYPGSMTRIKESGLGRNASHGCVRLSLSNAKWIYYNIPNGTKVKVY